MAKDERTIYDASIGDKAKSPLALKLSALIPKEKTKALAEALGCSVQAVNQYKLGTARPKRDNLVKIANFCGVSVDYLLDITDVPTRNTNIQGVHEYTGLSVGAIEALRDMLDNGERKCIAILNMLLENYDFRTVLLDMVSAVDTIYKTDNLERSINETGTDEKTGEPYKKLSGMSAAENDVNNATRRMTVILTNMLQRVIDERSGNNNDD